MAKPPNRFEQADEFGIGSRSDGTLAIFTPEEASKLVAERDAEEGSDSDDISDLDDLDKLFSKKT